MSSFFQKHEHSHKAGISTIFILDWDDTLFPTSWFLTNNINKYKLDNYFNKLDQELNIFLNKLLEVGKIIIITNASYDWVIESSKFLKQTHQLITQLKIISAREIYQHKTDQIKWKILTFLEYFKNNIEYYNNIISIGDAEYEYNAIVTLYKLNNKKKIFFKSIKFIKYPTFDYLLEQLKILNIVDNIYINKRHSDILFVKKFEYK